jgi:hypothetical protein
MLFQVVARSAFRRFSPRVKRIVKKAVKKAGRLSKKAARDTGNYLGKESFKLSRRTAMAVAKRYRRKTFLGKASRYYLRKTV